MKKRKFFILLFCLFAGITLITTSCATKDTPTDQVEEYTVTFNSMGGSAVAAQTVKNGENAAEPIDPIKEGYTFKGWYQEEECINIWHFDLYNVLKNITLFAKWEEGQPTPAPVTYSITYVSDHGTKPTDVAEATTLPNPLPSMSETGWQFLGWYTTDTFEESNKAEAGATLSANATLYAKWEEVSTPPTPVETYSITYVSDHGTKPEDVAEATTLPDPLPSMSETGWTFLGWYTTDTFEESSKAVAGATLSEDVTLHAKWEEGSTPVVTYSITYVSDHGTKPANVNAATTLPNPLPSMSAIGWQFLGWYTTSTYVESSKAVAGATLSANTTLYAKWEEGSTPVVTYSITYVSEHGTKPANVSAATTLPNPLPVLSETGWEFLGWYTTSTYVESSKAVAGATLSANATLYAKWEQHTYSVTYNINGKGEQPQNIDKTPTLPNPLPILTDSTQSFAGWYFDSEFKEKAKAGMVLTEDVTLYAKWVDKQSVVLDVAEGYLESAYLEWKGLDGCEDYHVYYKTATAADAQYKQIDPQLIREYPNKYRADIVGLSAGNYTVKVVPVYENVEHGDGAIENVVVTAHDRSGFGFSQNSDCKTASGAYNDDGTLKSNAKVIYVSSSNAKTVTCEIGGTTYTGLQTILDAQKEGTTPLNVRILGLIEINDLDDYLSSEEGIQIKGKNGYAPMNLTIEGIGEDATCKGFGFLIRNCANVEMRNLAIMNHLDDAVSIDTKNCNLWIHNLDLYYGGPGGDSDQAKGDGFIDIKKSQYCTVSYNHFYDSGKSCLIDASEVSSGGADYLTYHHNWFDHSDSRHPRIRNSKNVHIYNNYYDGISKYGVGATTESSAFVEANYFRNVKYPMMIAGQGSDVDPANPKGIFSGNTGGMIKAYNNRIVEGGTFVSQNDNATDFDAVVVANRNDKVTGYSCKKGGGTYTNFDTDASIMYTYTPDNVDDVVSIVTSYAGRINGGDFHWKFNNSVDDADYSVNALLKQAIVNYKSTLIRVLGIEGTQSGGSTGGGTTGGNEPGTGEDNPPIVAGESVHNFTTDGKDSSIFTITGNLSSSKGTVTYKSLTLTQCLKMESSTSISFNTSDSMVLVLVFHEPAATILVDETEYTATNGIAQISLNSGSHIIKKGDSANLFYIELGKAQ